MRHEALEGVRAARENASAAAEVARGVMEGADEADLIVVDPIGIHLDPGPRGSPPKVSTLPPGRTSARARSQASTVPAASMTTSAFRGSSAGARRTSLRAPPILARADARDGRRPRRRRTRRASDRWGRRPTIATVSPRWTRATSIPCRQHASGSAIAATWGPGRAGRGGGCRRAIRSGTRSTSAYAPFRSGKRCSQGSHVPAMSTPGTTRRGLEFATTMRRPVVTSMPHAS